MPPDLNSVMSKDHLPMPDRRRFPLQLLALAAAGTRLPQAAFAQTGDFPSRPVRLVVPFAAGGGPDLLARATAVRMAPALGKGGAVFVENVVGAAGIVAAQNVARAAPDGYTLLMGASSHIVQKALQPSVKFDPQKDFAPISTIGLAPAVLVVAADSPYRSVDDLVAAARKNPGKLNYASGGIGSAAHLCAAALTLHTGIDVLHVPYKGSVEIIPALLSRSVHFAFPIASTAVPHVQSGKVRALAVTSAKRLATLPQVPTLRELLGSEDLVLDAWFGLWAPAGTPQATVQALFKAVHQAFDDPALRKDTEEAGTVVSLSASPQAFTAFIQTETAKLERLVKAMEGSIR